MALVHDVAESIVGDITPHDGVSNEDKHKRESDAIQEIKGLLGEGTSAGETSDRLDPFDICRSSYCNRLLKTNNPTTATSRLRPGACAH